MSTESAQNRSDGDGAAKGTPAVGGTAARRARQAEQRKAATATTTRGAAQRRRAASVGAGVGAPGATGTGSRVITEAARRQLDPDRLVVLEEERDFLLRSLVDLEREHDVGDVDEHDYEALKDDYTVRAAATLRAIETREAVLSAVRPPRDRGRAWALVAVVAVLAIGLGIFVAQSSGRRGSNTVTGDIRQSTRDQLLEARTLYSQQNYADAVKLYDEILQASPANTEALTYKGWLLYLTAQSAGNSEDRNTLIATGLRSLNDAINVNGDYSDAHIFRAILYKSLGESDLALSDLNRVRSDAIPADMTGMVEQLRKQLQAATDGSPPGSTTPVTTP